MGAIVPLGELPSPCVDNAADLSQRRHQTRSDVAVAVANDDFPAVAFRANDFAPKRVGQGPCDAEETTFGHAKRHTTGR
jgi:hypothetical protein